jgi:hypothetical protein
MSLGDLLMGRNLLTDEQLDEAVERFKMAGGTLADSVVALGFLGREELDEILREPPLAPDTVESTGLDRQFLLNYMMRLLSVFGVETIPDASEQAKLPTGVVQELFEEAKDKRFIEIIGPSPRQPHVLRYLLTDAGRDWAAQAMRQCQYTGPAPVTLADYQVQVSKQSIGYERASAPDLTRSFSSLVLPKYVLDRLGPAVNSGKEILLYGGSGNGKTSIAEAVGRTFRQRIYLPRAIEVDGQIIKFFDPAVHEEVEPAAGVGSSQGGSLFRDAREVDPRWVLCRRPVVLTAGELTLEMLDLNFDTVSKFYEAPAHIKATGGVFIIDDFGRQQVRPADILNRWILPLERRVDYLTLHTGMKLKMPFDELVVFSTNYPPEKMMDEAALRRIRYKLRIDPPNFQDYEKIFQRVCDAHSLTLFPDVLAFLIEKFYPETGLPSAAFHPKFIVEHVVARCNFEGVPPRLTVDRVKEALQNLLVSDTARATLGEA